ncbi:hypothetical protein ARMGADRAFT_1038223 [Armillaria gallica]|uniref:Uncharacterized protein n=1 Tax=Armillaria gallica TaxID=47427 RepID=A0A2H3CIK6_ARMGA|nr:hypothetical protein ARMGADRAFT_1038223 [Armillaria gallica]
MQLRSFGFLVSTAPYEFTSSLYARLRYHLVKNAYVMATGYNDVYQCQTRAPSHRNRYLVEEWCTLRKGNFERSWYYIIGTTSQQTLDIRKTTMFLMQPKRLVDLSSSALPDGNRECEARMLCTHDDDPSYPSGISSSPLLNVLRSTDITSTDLRNFMRRIAFVAMGVDPLFVNGNRNLPFESISFYAPMATTLPSIMEPARASLDELVAQFD